MKFDDESESEFYKLTGNTVSTVENYIIGITLNSPLGKSIFRKKKNESFKFEVDSKIIIGHVVNIDYR
ncbi:MAG: GreA/GreB family elongation factor [bacterium]|nr:GreA/GreB family elongation factor [bacterium]